MSVEVLGVHFLWGGSVGLLSVTRSRAAAAVWGGPAVPPTVGLTQRQVSAVPLTVALQSRNQQEAKNQHSAGREEQTRAAGQDKHTHTHGRAHESTLEARRLCRSTGNTKTAFDLQLFWGLSNSWFKVSLKMGLVADGEESRWNAVRKAGPHPACSKHNRDTSLKKIRQTTAAFILYFISQPFRAYLNSWQKRTTAPWDWLFFQNRFWLLGRNQQNSLFSLPFWNWL